MVTKVIDPKKHGNKVYDNKGSSLRLVRYLQHERKDDSPEENGIFFSREADNIKPEEVLQAIDHNVKGLKKDEEKFHSLLISPSQEELQHIGNDVEKLKAYTRQVMENYARNFRIKEGKELQSEDLVWFATIHFERKYKGNDAEVRAGKAKAGQLKPGLQTHVHVTVSARDAAQKITLHPDGRKERFNQGDWTRKNREDFKRLFGYVYQPILQDQQQRVQKGVETLHKQFGLELKDLDPVKVQQIASAAGYSSQFYKNLSRLQYQLKQTQGTGKQAERSPVLEGAYATLAQAKKDHQMEYLQKRIQGVMSQHHLTEHEFDSKAVTQAAQQNGYSRRFYRALRNLDKQIREGGRVPKDYLTTLAADAATPTSTKGYHVGNKEIPSPEGQRHTASTEQREKMERSLMLNAKASLDTLSSGFYTLRSLMSAPSSREEGVGGTKFEEREGSPQKRRERRRRQDQKDRGMRR